MSNFCPLCRLRISDWMISWGKTVMINVHWYHKSCVQDFILRHGKEPNNDHEDDGA